MSMAFSGTMQGSFISDATPKLITLRSGFDWIHVYNKTVSYAAGANTGAEFRFNPHVDTNGRGTIYTKTIATNALQVGQIAVGSGFFTYDSSIQQPGDSVAITGIDGSNPPVVSAVTTGLFDGDVVRIYRTVGALQLAGMDFTIGNVQAGSFELAYMDQIVNANPGAGSYRKIPYNPIYYPRTRYITAITQEDEARVFFSVTHGYTVGQKLTFYVPAVTSARYGMTEMDGITATVLAVNTATNSVTIDVDTSGFTAFSFPITTDPEFTPAYVTPAGMDSAVQNAANISPLGAAYRDEAQLGVLLMPGTGGPAGVDGNVIEWIAGVSWNM